MPAQTLPRRGLIAYGFGALGWSISINIISVLLNYIYLPPSNAGMSNLIPQITLFGLFNIISIILFTGRGFDAVVDPFIAHLSDSWKGKIGRRIPLMRAAFIPLSISCVLIFFPLQHNQSNINILWLAGTQLCYYFFFGLYVIPYNALLAEMGHNTQAKIDLSTAQSIGFMAGVLISSASPAIVTGIMKAGITADKLVAYQYTIAALNIFAAVCLAYTAFAIDEKKYCNAPKITESFFKSLKTTLSNGNFIIFAVADASYFMSIAIISAGLMYYVTAMLFLDEWIGTLFVFAMVIITLIFYVVVNRLGGKYSKRKMMVWSFVAVAVVFFEIFFLGKVPVSPYIQVTVLMITFGIPNAFLGILPATVIADIAQADFKESGENKEGMFFGMRAFFQKVGQTAGVTVFAMLTLYGKDPHHDFGLRLSGLVGAVLCLMSAVAYSRYKEPEKE